MTSVTKKPKAPKLEDVQRLARKAAEKNDGKIRKDSLVSHLDRAYQRKKAK